MKQIIFNYPIKQIREEVEKRTSYLGKMRNTESEPHLLDRLSLTEGEDFLFIEYLREAATETYNWIRAFGRNVTHAYELLEANNTKEVFEHSGVHITSVSNESDNIQSFKFSPIISGITWKEEQHFFAENRNKNEYISINRNKNKDILLEDEGYNQSGDVYVYAWDNESEVFYSTTESISTGDMLFTQTEVNNALALTGGSSRVQYLETRHNSTWYLYITSVNNNAIKGTLSIKFFTTTVYVGLATSVSYKYTLHYKTHIPGTPIVDEHNVSKSFTIDSNQIDTVCDFDIQIDNTEFGMPELVADINDLPVIEFEITKIYSDRIDLYANEYVAYNYYKNGSKKIEYWIVGEDCTDNNFMEHSRKLEGDYRENIIYRLELPDWNDENMMMRVRNNLREALVNYIMWRWFETTLPTEANVYYEKWEIHAHNAQLGLNAEKKLLNRRYNMF